MKRLLVLVALLPGCATWDKGLDIIDGGLVAASATVDVFRAAGEDVKNLWGNAWSPLGLKDTPLGKPFDAPTE